MEIISIIKYEVIFNDFGDDIMVVPPFKEFFLPVLMAFKDNDFHSKSEVADYIAKYFNLSDEDLLEKTENANMPRYKDRTAWAITYLYQAGLLKRKQRGTYVISDEGIKVLQSDIEEIDENFLKNYSSFRKFKNLNDNLNFHLKNVGPINEANIELGKINVIGGWNATGKSTASKLLYCFLKSTSSKRQEFSHDSIISEIDLIFRLIRRRVPINHIPELSEFYRKYYGEYTLTDDYYVKLEIYDKFKEIIYDLEPNEHYLSEKRLDSLFDDFDGIDGLINIVEENSFDLYSLILRKALNSEISKNLGGFAEFKGYKDYNYFDFILNFDKNQFENYQDYITFNDVFYMDCFSILDYFNGYRLNNTDHIQSFGKSISLDSDESNELFDEVKNSDIIKIQEDIKSLINGEFIVEDGELIFSSNDGVKSTLNITSSGVKQIGTLQLLLSYRKLKDNCFLIIDEPEVNLHPKWQYQFAQILVLLAKKLNIILYINSHSPLFIEAIRTYSEKYDLLDDTNFYLTDESETFGKYDFLRISPENLNIVYHALGQPYDELSKISIENEFKL